MYFSGYSHLSISFLFVEVGLELKHSFCYNICVNDNYNYRNIILISEKSSIFRYENPFPLSIRESKEYPRLPYVFDTTCTF